MLSAIFLMIGTTELIVIGGAILLFFGGKKIPELMKSMGQGVRSFKEGMREGMPDEPMADGEPAVKGEDCDELLDKDEPKTSQSKHD